MLDQLEEYEKLMGHPPPVAPDEESWQWAYNTQRDREKLLDLIQDEAEAEVCEQGVLF